MFVVVTSFKNDEKSCPPTPLKTVNTTHILIDQVHTFHNSYFKGHMGRAATVLQKTFN